jgi:hypothetical protein
MEVDSSPYYKVIADNFAFGEGEICGRRKNLGLNKAPLIFSGENYLFSSITFMHTMMFYILWYH